MVVAGNYIREPCSSDQLCSGLEAGIEAAIHAMNDLFDEKKGKGWDVLLVDASNAFNALNRKAAQWNARHLWPCGCRFLFNTYGGPAALLLDGSNTLLFSREGVTQGDPLSVVPRRGMQMKQTVAVSWTVSLYGSNDFFKTVQLSDTTPSPERLTLSSTYAICQMRDDCLSR